MAIPALKGDGDGVEEAGVTEVGELAGTSVVVAVGQSKEVLGGRVVQPHARSAPVWTAYVAGASPHTHQPEPLAMAVQVFWGSAVW